MLSLFVSSVQKEFAAERAAIRDFVAGDDLLRRFFQVFLFEDIPAMDQRADTLYLTEVDRCDVYLCLLGLEYGFEDEEGVSPTEREFDRATEAGKYRLAFLAANSKGVHPKEQIFISRVVEQLVRRRFSSVEDLITGVYRGLVEFLASKGHLRTLPFDAAACPRATMADLSAEKADLFLARAKSNRGYALGPGTPLADLLEHLNLVDDHQPTHAAILLFGRTPSGSCLHRRSSACTSMADRCKSRFLPTRSTKGPCSNWPTRRSTSSCRSWRGRWDPE